MAETNSLLNCRTGNRTTSSNLVPSALRNKSGRRRSVKERRFFVRWRRRKLAFERMPPCKKLVPVARLPRLIALGNSEMCKGASATAQISVPAPIITIFCARWEKSAETLHRKRPPRPFSVQGPKHIIPPCTKEPEIQTILPRLPRGYAPWCCQWLVGWEGECRVGRPERYSSRSVILAGVKSGFEHSWIIRWTSSVFCVASIELR